jgi:hypothetical protein
MTIQMILMLVISHLAHFLDKLIVDNMCQDLLWLILSLLLLMKLELEIIGKCFIHNILFLVNKMQQAILEEENTLLVEIYLIYVLIQ